MIDDSKKKKKNVFLKNFPFSHLPAVRSFLLHLRLNSDSPIRRVKTRRKATSHYRYRLISRSVLNERPRSAIVLSSLFVRSPVKCHLLPAGADSHGDPSEFIDNYCSRYIVPHFRSFSSLFKPRTACSYKITCGGFVPPPPPITKNAVKTIQDYYLTICVWRYTLKFEYCD